MEKDTRASTATERFGQAGTRADVKEALLWKRSDLAGRLRQMDAAISRVRREYVSRLEHLQAQKKPLEDALYHVEALLRFERQGAAGEAEVAGDTPPVGISVKESLTDAAIGLLEDAGRPMHYKDLAARLQQSGFYIPGRDPAATLLSRITRDGRFKRAKKRGTYTLGDRRVGSASRESLTDSSAGHVGKAEDLLSHREPTTLVRPWKSELGTAWDLVLSNRLGYQASLFAVGMRYGAS